MRSRLLRAVVCAFTVLLLASCGRRDREEPAPAAAPVGTGKHWVEDERLRGVMAELSRQSAHWPAGVPDDPESPVSVEARQAFAAAAALAEGLARAARDIPRSVADREMTAETRRGFNEEARRLRDHALRLKDAARDRKVEPMQRALDGISSSCISCHLRYRDFTGELDVRRASAR